MLSMEKRGFARGVTTFLGFKSHPPHLCKQNAGVVRNGGFALVMLLAFPEYFVALEVAYKLSNQSSASLQTSFSVLLLRPFVCKPND
jgi:hypothetical protein